MQTKAPAQQAQQNQSQNDPKSSRPAQAQFEDARPEAAAQLRMQSVMADSAQATQLKSAQAMMAAKPNNTGLPNQLKAGIENLSGYSMDDVQVHYNSDKPAQLNAHAYAQGADIHVAPGQEQHLPHEAWHVVQQKQGRVQPTMQMKAGVPVNDDAGLENEADVMGAKAMQMSVQDADTKPMLSKNIDGKKTAQLVLDDEAVEAFADMSDEDLEAMNLDDAEKEQIGRYRSERAAKEKEAEEWGSALASRQRGTKCVSWDYGGKNYHINLGLGVYHVTEEASPKIHYFFEGFGAAIKDKPSGNGGKHDKLFSALPSAVQIFIKANFNALLL